MKKRNILLPLGTIATSFSLISCLTAPLLVKQNDVFVPQKNLKANKKLYDKFDFIDSKTLKTYAYIEVSANDATNVYIKTGEGESSFEIYANGSITLQVHGIEEEAILKTIAFGDYDPIAIGGNFYRQNIENKNFTTSVTLTLEGKPGTQIPASLKGNMHIITLFDHHTRLWSNTGVEEATLLAKVPETGTNKVYRVFYSEGDFWFEWGEKKEMKQMQLFHADAHYQISDPNPIWTIDDLSIGSSQALKVILPKTADEFHYIFRITNNIDDVQDCLVCAHNLNYRDPQNPWKDKNFWYSWNGDQWPIKDLDGARLWAKLITNKPLIFTDEYLRTLDDITINDLIILSANWPTQDVKASSIKIVDTGYTNTITTQSGIGAKVLNPISVLPSPVYAITDLEYKVYYGGKTDLAPNFIYVDNKGYLTIKKNTWEIYPDGQDFDIFATDKKSGCVSSNKATIKIYIKGAPTPKIKDMTLSDVPQNNLLIDPRTGYIAPKNVKTLITSEDGREIPQDVSYSLELKSGDVPSWLTIDSEGYVKVSPRTGAKEETIEFRVKSTSLYNDAYCVNSEWLKWKLSENDVDAVPINWAALICCAVIGGALILGGGAFWLWDFNRTKKARNARKKYDKAFGVEARQEVEEENKQAAKADKKEKKAQPKEKKKKVNPFKKFWNWLTMKDLRDKSKEKHDGKEK